MIRTNMWETNKFRILKIIYPLLFSLGIKKNTQLNHNIIPRALLWREYHFLFTWRCLVSLIPAKDLFQITPMNEWITGETPILILLLPLPFLSLTSTSSSSTFSLPSRLSFPIPFLHSSSALRNFSHGWRVRCHRSGNWAQGMHPQRPALC